MPEGDAGMRILPQPNEALRRMALALLGHRIVMLTLVDAGGAPTSRPLTPLEMDAGGLFWFMVSRSSLQALPAAGGCAASIAFARPESLACIAVAGRAHAVEHAGRKQELWKIASPPWFDGPRDPDLLLIAVQPERAEIWYGPSCRSEALLCNKSELHIRPRLASVPRRQSASLALQGR